MEGYFTVQVPVTTASDVIAAYRKARSLTGHLVGYDLAQGKAVIAIPNEYRADFEAYIANLTK